MKGLDFMIFDTELRQRLCLATAGAALLSVAGFSSATPAWAAEDTNMFNSVLGFVGMQFDKEPDSIDYRARAPIVVPPRTDLPPPKEAVRDPAWPNDPDVAAERRAALRFAKARAAVDAKFAGRNVSDGAAARPRPIARRMAPPTNVRRVPERQYVSIRLGKF